VLNKSFSYRFEQSLYENNVGGGSTGHFWIAYNQLLHGDGHLIVGKVDAPAPPAFSYWHDASAFSSPEIAVGQHGYLLDGTRWGVGFNYVPKNYVKQPYKSNWHISETRRRSIIRRSFSNSNPYAPDQSGSDRAFQYKVAFARPDQPIEAGVYGAVGSYILANGYAHPSDAYRATGVYAQRDPVGHVPGVLVFYQQTYDANVGPGDGSTPLVQSATSRAFALELSESFLHGDVMLAVRPVEYLSGLQASATGFDTERTAQPHYGTFNVIARDPKFSPYLYFVFESGVGAASDARYAQPAWTAQVRWAAPVFGAPAIRRVPAGLRPVAVADATPAASTSVGTSDASPSPEAVQAGKAVFVANCAACHNANGTGGAGPSLHQVATTKTFAQTVDFIEHPSGGIMPKLYPGTLSEAQVKEVTAYVRATFH